MSKAEYSSCEFEEDLAVQACVEMTPPWAILQVVFVLVLATGATLGDQDHQIDVVGSGEFPF